mgnify:CR=1 FL=1|jgi:hypothetical protein
MTQVRPRRTRAGGGPLTPYLLQIGNNSPYAIAIFVHFVYSMDRGTHPSQNGTAV